MSAREAGSVLETLGPGDRAMSSGTHCPGLSYGRLSWAIAPWIQMGHKEVTSALRTGNVVMACALQPHHSGHSRPAWPSLLGPAWHVVGTRNPPSAQGYLLNGLGGAGNGFCVIGQAHPERWDCAASAILTPTGCWPLPRNMD